MPRFTIVRNGALGDILTILHLRDQIRQKFGPFDLYCHPTCHAILNTFVEKNDLCDGFYSSLTGFPAHALGLTMYPFHEGYPNQGHPKKHILHYVQDELGLPNEWPDGLSLIGGIKQKNLITIQTTTGWSRWKEYPWNEDLIDALRLDFRIVQVGGPNTPILNGIKEHTIGLPFEDSLLMQSQAAFHIGPDSVFNHTTHYKWSGGRTLGVIYFGSTSHKLTGYPTNKNLSLDLPCQPCFRENPEISNQNITPCPYGHKCLNDLTPEQVVSIIRESYDKIN